MAGTVSKTRARTLTQRIWELQVGLAEFASDLVTLLSGNVGRSVTATLSLFLVGHPIIQFVVSYRAGVLLISVPLTMMLLGGIFGLRLCYSGWYHD